MKIKNVLIASALGFGLCIALFFVLDWMEIGPRWDSSSLKSSRLDDELPQLDTSGPQPKIVADEVVHDFEVMGAGEEKSHAFEIRNEGEAQLEIVKVSKACKCTSGAADEYFLEPGESTMVRISWQPKKPDPNFQQIVKVITNDPANQEFHLKIKGAVEPLIVMEPVIEWNVGEIVEDKPTVVRGTIASRVVDSFNVLEVVADSELLTANYEPLQADDLVSKDVKSGYRVTVTLAPGIKIGSFREKLTVRTDLNDGTNFPWFLSGSRFGPYRIMPMPGTAWRSDKLLLNLGKFKAADGSKAKLMMFVSGLDEGNDLEFVDVQSDVNYVKVNLEPAPSSSANAKKKYFLTFEVPPGSPRATRIGDATTSIKVKTNHPKAKDIEFKVQFIAL